MPSDKELKAALDIIQALLTAPLPGAARRKEMLTQVYRTLMQMIPEQDGEGILESSPEPLGDGNDLDLPFLE